MIIIGLYDIVAQELTVSLLPNALFEVQHLFAYLNMYRKNAIRSKVEAMQANQVS